MGKRIFPYATILLLLATSCLRKNKLIVSETFFGEEVEIRQNLVFKFNHDILPDTLNGKWDSVQYIKFTPYVKGLFKWQYPDQLIFSPTGNFKPATRYKAVLTPSLLRHFKKGLETGNDVIEFHTQNLEVTGTSSWWTRIDGDLALNITLTFNYAVDPQIVKDYLVLDAGGLREFDMVTQAAGKELTLRTRGFENKDLSNVKLTATLKQGLKCIECTDAVLKPTLFRADVSSPAQLTVNSISPLYAAGEGIIDVQFNQPLDETNAAQYIKIDPFVTFETESSESGITLKGGFAEGASYTITIAKGLKGMAGGMLQHDYTENISFGQSGPSLTFGNSKGVYLSSKSSKLVGVRINNIPRVSVRIYKIYENNIMSFMRHNRYNDYWGDGEGQMDVTYSDYELSSYGDVLLDQEYETRNLPFVNGQRYLSLDFSDKVPFSGVYLISLRSSDDQWLNVTKLVAVSDLGLMARTGIDEINVFVNSIKDATTISNAKVSVFSTNNQLLFTGNTNSEGIAVFSGMSAGYKNFHAGMITVRSGNDFNYMLLDDSRIETSRFETAGLNDNPSGFHAYIYGDREIYRPGDSVYINTILRKNDGMLQSDVPFRLKILQPNGRELAVFRKTAAGQGASETRIQLPASAPTGTYMVEAYTFNDILIGSRALSVEEFIPDRINVKLTTGADIYTVPDTVYLNATAVNLFGPPAAGRNYDIDFSLSMKHFAPKGFEAYNFMVNGAEKTQLPSIFRQGKTDAKGAIAENFPLTEQLASTGMLSGRIFVTVFDETGRPVNRLQSFDVATQTVFFGVKVSDNYATAGQQMQAGFCAVDSKGKPVSATAEVKFIKINYHNLLERGYSDAYHYVSKKEERMLSKRSITIGQQGSTIPFIPSESGEYAVRIYINGTDRFVEKTFYAYGWGLTSAGSFAVNTDGEIDISSDKELYKPGDKARILFKTPFAGKLLVTVERNSVLQHFYIGTDKRSAELLLDIKEEYLPTIYITATLYRPLDQGTIPLTVAHGLLPLHVEKKDNKLPLSIVAATTSRSRARQTITVKTKPGIPVEMTIAVVDEGIMQLKNSETPDPYKFFYQKRALAVNSYDIYPSLLPDVVLKRSSAGGDAYNLQKRVNPLTNKRVKLVASWSGILKTNKSGEASYTVDIPQFSGDLRVMAAAWYNSSFGSAEHHIKVADPIVISTALPRFLSPRDTIYIPVTLSNTTLQVLNTETSIDVKGGLMSTGSVRTKAMIQPNSEASVEFKAFAAPAVGQARVITTAEAGGNIYSDVTEITVRPPASLQKTSRSGVLKGGSNLELDFTTDYIPSTMASQLIVSRSPVAQFSDQLSYLFDYPYGCVEQITSIAFPQLYLDNLIKAIKNKPNQPLNIANNINAAIQKLQSMQLYNGALSYWPGNAHESWWGSVYAAHFLSEAQKAGYDVNTKTLNRLLDYAAKKAKEKNTETLWYYEDGGNVKQRTIPAKDIFYSLYVLALNGEKDLSTMNYYKSRWKDLAIDSRYLLACTYLATGDRKNYDALLPRQFAGEESLHATGGSFYSYLRDQALAMNALLTVDPGNVQLPDMARRISQSLQQQKWINTQERSFAFLALGKFMKMNSGSSATASFILADGSRKTFTGTDLAVKNVTGKVSAQTEGSGSIYYVWMAEGLTKDGSFKEEDSNLKIRRSYFDRLGKQVTSGTFKQNDLIVVKLTLENTARTPVENIVITDMLPAGFEIENPRIGAVPELSWIRDSTEPEYKDIRDDRINLFTSATYKPANYYYLVRAVSRGNFVTGPASADAMYNGEYHSYHGSGRIIVK